MPGKKVEIICGCHAVRHVLARRPHDVLEVFIPAGRNRPVKLHGLISACECHGISIQPVSRSKLDRLTGMGSHQGVAARCREPVRQDGVGLDELCAEKPDPFSIILALDRVTDPHNLGACVRTADAAGVEAIIVPKGHSAPLNATVKKVASGGAENVRTIMVGNLARSLRRLHEAGYLVIGTTESADRSIYEMDVPLPAVLVVGSEEKGMRRNTREHCDLLVKIPMHGLVESLNLSVATGICLYELRRRSMNAGKP